LPRFAQEQEGMQRAALKQANGRFDKKA